jgi:LuxR family quorum sensing-dependent transcriptional regulator
MMIANSLIADSESFRDMTDGGQVFDFVEERFRSFGATHFLVTGLPLPGRPIEPLVLRLNWGELRADRHAGIALDASDPALRLALRAKRAFLWLEGRDLEGIAPESVILNQIGPARHARLIGVPISSFLPYQACILAGGVDLDINTKAMLAIDYFCTEAFRRLFALNYLRPERPGDLSARERKVVELSATGKTASDIAEVLKISQRTVHAHLQNASEKLRAHNKTHTVVEALRYGQITV